MNNKLAIKDLSRISMMAVLISVCSWLSVPFIVPFTMQTFGIFCALLLLGGKRGVMAVLLYILLGAVGLPVFSNFTGGIGRLFGVTGGYIIGFIPMSLVYWLLTSRLGGGMTVRVTALLAGLALCYAFGTVWFVYIYSVNAPVSVWSALSMCVFPFIVPDIIKLMLAIYIGKRLKK